WVGEGGGSGDAVGRHVALKQVELVLPEQLAGVGVEALDPLLLGFALAGGVLDVKVIAEDDRRGAAAVGGFPRQVLAGQGPFLGQALLLGHAGTGGAAPVGPIGGGGGAARASPGGP